MKTRVTNKSKSGNRASNVLKDLRIADPLSLGKMQNIVGGRGHAQVEASQIGIPNNVPGPMSHAMVQ